MASGPSSSARGQQAATARVRCLWDSSSLYLLAEVRDADVSAAGDAPWDDYLHNRDNPCGETRDLWHHEAGCGAWLVVTRNTATHEIMSAELAEKVKR